MVETPIVPTSTTSNIVEEVETILPARRIELTEEATGVTGMADAYVREIIIQINHFLQMN